MYPSSVTAKSTPTPPLIFSSNDRFASPLTVNQLAPMGSDKLRSAQKLPGVENFVSGTGVGGGVKLPSVRNLLGFREQPRRASSLPEVDRLALSSQTIPSAFTGSEQHKRSAELPHSATIPSHHHQIKYQEVSHIPLSPESS